MQWYRGGLVGVNPPGEVFEFIEVSILSESPNRLYNDLLYKGVVGVWLLVRPPPTREARVAGVAGRESEHGI